MGKAYKKKTSRKKPTSLGKRKRISRRKMKGGVAFNTSFSTSSLPSSTYIPLNPNVNDNPSWNQIDARLLPAMGGGKRTRKRRGAKKTRKSRTHKKHGGSDTTPETANDTEHSTASVTAPSTAPSTLTRLYRQGHHFLFPGDKTAGEKREKEKEFCENVRDNYIRIDGYKLWDYYYNDNTMKERENSFLKDIVFYRHNKESSPGCDLEELGTLRNDKTWDQLHYYQEIEKRKYYHVIPTLEHGLLHFSNNKKLIKAFIRTANVKWGDLNEQYTLFYIKKEDFKEEDLNEKDRKAFNNMKVDQREDPYLNIVDPNDRYNRRFSNIRNYYETWFVRSRLYGIVPEKDEYEIMKAYYWKQGLESKPKFKKG